MDIIFGSNDPILLFKRENDVVLFFSFNKKHQDEASARKFWDWKQTGPEDIWEIPPTLLANKIKTVLM